MERRESTPDAARSFRYSRAMAWFYIVAPPLVGLGFLVGFGKRFEPFTGWSIAESVSLTSILLLVAAGFWYQSVAVIVDENAITLRTCIRQRVTQFRDIQKIDIICTSGRGATKTLNVFDTSGRRVICVYESLQDFEDLVYLLKFNCRGYAVQMRRRDSFGEWSPI
jgi:hypothetical protein